MEVLIGEEAGPILPTTVRNHFAVLAALSEKSALEAAPAHSAARARRLRPRPESLRRVPHSTAFLPGVDANAHAGAGREAQRFTLAIAPIVDGRIEVVQAEASG